MTYSELQDLCHEKRISLTSVAECANMTLRGFRVGMINRTLQIKAIEAVCNRLNITPNQFIGWKEDISTFQTNQLGVVNNQNIGASGIDILQQQLAVKDKQIESLMQLLSKYQ